MNRERVLEILKENCPDIDVETTTELVSGGQIDSIELLQIISDLEEAFGVSIIMDEITPKNFDSIDAIVETISRL